MKKILIILCFLFCFIHALHSFNGEFSVSLGVVGLSMSSDLGNSDGFLFGRLLNFMYQFENGLGVTLSPLTFLLHFDGSDDSVTTDKSLLTFFNTSLYYNFFNKRRENFLLGPFISAKAISLRDARFIEFRTGLTFSLRNIYLNREDNIFNSDFFILEAGYKFNRAGNHGVFFHVGIDLLALFFLVNIFGPSE